MRLKNCQRQSARSLVRREKVKKLGGRHRAFKLFAVSWLAPPGLSSKLRGRDAAFALSQPGHATPLSEIMVPAAGPQPFWIPKGKIVNRFGQAFTTEQHHYVRYLWSGLDSLETFYRIHQPETTVSAHFIHSTPADGARASWSGKPWEYAAPTGTDTPPRDYEAYGPISYLELATEAARLDLVQRSIKNKGYLGGNKRQPKSVITGQLFIHDNGDFRVVIRSGNHRTAVLVRLGWELIPVHHELRLWPVRLGDLALWPGVVDGRYSLETAHAVFESHFRPGHQQLLPGW